MSGLVHPDQNVRNATQNSLCRAVNRRRGCCACRASNCRRRARFSRTRSSRERKALTIQPRKCRSDAIIAGIISEKSESSFAPSHSFCRCTTFWRGTGSVRLATLSTRICLKEFSPRWVVIVFRKSSLSRCLIPSHSSLHLTVAGCRNYPRMKNSDGNCSTIGY
jgi:hypothetical protein